MVDMKKQYLVASFIISTLFVPLLASAATADEIRAQIQSLLSQITALQAQLNNLTTSTISTPSNSCPNLYRALSRGSRGSDVISLQQFLIAQGLLSNDLATGFFGSMTEAATQRWQAQNSVVSYGDVNTTGYGVIGIRTRAAIAAKCGTTPVLPSGSLCPVVTGGSCPQGHIGSYISENGCTVLKCTPPSFSKPTVSASVSSQSFKQGDTVVVNWQVNNEVHLLKHVVMSLDLYTAGGGYVQKIYGTSGTLAGTKQWDGRTVCPFESWLCSFVTPGSYKVRATLTHDETGNTSIATAETGVFDIITASTITPPVADTFNASPISGTAPLVVKFTSSRAGTIEFGDGQSGALVDSCRAKDCVPQYYLDHTYSSQGTFSATLVTYGGSCETCLDYVRKVLGIVAITVTGQSAVPQAFRIISPNGGETITIGQSFAIRWNTDGASLGGYGSNLVKLSLIPQNVGYKDERPLVIGNFRAGDLSYTWSPSSALAGDSYRIKAVLSNGTCEPVGPYPFTNIGVCLAMSQTLATDESDGWFRIR